MTYGPPQAIPEYLAEIIREIGGPLVTRSCEFDFPPAWAFGFAWALSDVRILLEKSASETSVTFEPLTYFQYIHDGYRWHISVAEGATEDFLLRNWLINRLDFVPTCCVICGSSLRSEQEVDKYHYCPHHQISSLPPGVSWENIVYEHLIGLKSVHENAGVALDDLSLRIHQSASEKIAKKFPGEISLTAALTIPTGWYPAHVELMRKLRDDGGGFIENSRLIDAAQKRLAKTTCPVCSDRATVAGEDGKTYCLAHVHNQKLGLFDSYCLALEIQFAFQNIPATDPTATTLPDSFPPGLLVRSWSLNWAPMDQGYGQLFDLILGRVDCEPIAYKIPQHWYVPAARAFKDLVETNNDRLKSSLSLITEIQWLSGNWRIEFHESVTNPAFVDKRLRNYLNRRCLPFCVVCGMDLDLDGTCSRHADHDESEPLPEMDQANLNRMKRFLRDILRDMKIHPTDPNWQVGDPIPAFSKPSDGVGEQIGASLPPTLVPIKDMPSADSSKGDAARLYKDYEILGKPLPLAGGGWNADLLCDQLQKEFPWIEIGPLHDYLVLAQFLRKKDFFKSPNLLMLGPPGTGKSAFCRRLAESVGLASYTHNCAGSSDARTFLGTARGWGNHVPGIVPILMKTHKVANFLMILEDLDRAGGSHWNGRIADAVLPYLEPSTAGSVNDECLQLPIDASAVSWVITANSKSGMDQAILSRCRIVQVHQPDQRHFDAVHAGILRAIAGEMECSVCELPELDDEVIELLFRAFSRSGNLRDLKRVYIKVLSVAAKDVRKCLVH